MTALTSHQRSQGESMAEKNAVIKTARITNDDHGLLTAWLDLDYGGTGQGFGGYALYLPKDFTHSTMQQNYAGHFIWRVMEIAGVERWDQLPGKTIRVRSERHTVDAIGHIVKDDWFSPSSDFKAMEAQRSPQACAEGEK
jgi:hypothetical protein